MTARRMTAIGAGQGLALTFIATCLFIFMCKVAAAVVMPFVIAVFLWYLINAIQRFLGYLSTKGGYKLPRFWRFLLAHIIIFAVGFFLYAMVKSNINDVIREAPKYQARLAEVLPQAAAMLGLDHTPTLHDVFKQVFASVDLAALMTGFAAMLTGMAGKTLIVLFYVGFLLYEQRWFDKKIQLMFGDKARETRVREVLKIIDGKIQRYIGVKAFVSLTDSTLTFLILTHFNVDFAGFWGVMAFFLHFIPYAGSFVAVTTPCLIALLQYGDVILLAQVLSALLISHAFLGHIMDPYLMGNNLNLSPIFIISNLAMWGMIWGIPGMFLAIPILAIATIVFSQFESTHAIAVLFSKTGFKGRRAKK